MVAVARPEAPQGLPASGPAREALRAAGQFWTPDWLAAAFATYVADAPPGPALDPACGDGALLRALLAERAPRGIYGCDLDPAMVEAARRSVAAASRVGGRGVLIERRDFPLDPPEGSFAAIVMNPPYLRHHRLSQGTKARLRERSAAALGGAAIDGLAGLHAHFLLHALALLRPGGRLAAVVPADILEGRYAGRLWSWILPRFALDGVATFSALATPFPGVDTNPVALFLRRGEPSPATAWSRWWAPPGDALRSWVGDGFRPQSATTADFAVRVASDATIAALGRPESAVPAAGAALGSLAAIHRGVSTGNNDFFHLTRDRARSLGLPATLLQLAVGRTRDAPGDLLDAAAIDRLDARGRATLLLTLGEAPVGDLPPAVRRYLERGEADGLADTPTGRSRRPWYRIDWHTPPPFLFAYLDRRRPRFIRNAIGAVPLTGFLGLHPLDRRPEALDDLWRRLSDPAVGERLRGLGKTYGNDGVKIEPRALLGLALPD